MKRFIIKHPLFSVIALMAITCLTPACRPDKTAPVGMPANRTAQIGGSWSLRSVTQTDLLAARYNFQDPSRPDVNLVTQDVTSAAPYTDFAITLNLDASQNPKDFSVSYGNAPHLVSLSSGSWNLDNPQYPATLRLFNGQDTIKLTLGSLASLSANVMTLQSVRYDGGKAVIQYNYIFNKTK